MSIKMSTGFSESHSPDKYEIKGTKSVDSSAASRMLTIDDVIGMGRNTLSEKIEAVYSCIRDKSETAGMIPLNLYDSNNMRKKDGRAYTIFTQQPNDYMTMQEFIELAVYWYEHKAVFYAYKQMNDNGSISAIIPFRFQTNVSPQMDQNGNVYYTYVTNDGRPTVTYNQEDLFIIKGMTTDGFTPIAALTQAATLFSSTTAQEENYRSLQVDGITSQMGLATDNLFNDVNKIQKVQDDWKMFRGKAGVSNIPVFENGLKPISLKLTPQETELLKSREFSVSRICRVYRVPVHRVGVADGDIKNVFDLDEAYFRSSIVPILKKIRDKLQTCLPRGLRIQFNYNDFYSGSPWRMAESVDKLVKGGLKSINQGKEALGDEPIEGGDVYAIDNNNVVYGNWTDLEKIQQMLYNQQNNKPKKEASEDEQ